MNKANVFNNRLFTTHCSLQLLWLNRLFVKGKLTFKCKRFKRPRKSSWHHPEKHIWHSPRDDVGSKCSQRQKEVSSSFSRYLSLWEMLPIHRPTSPDSSVWLFWNASVMKTSSETHLTELILTTYMQWLFLISRLQWSKLWMRRGLSPAHRLRNKTVC